MIKITNIKIKADLSDDELFEKIYKKYKINKNDVTERRIIKKQILCCICFFVHYIQIIPIKTV